MAWDARRPRFFDAERLEEGRLDADFFGMELPESLNGIPQPTKPRHLCDAGFRLMYREMEGVPFPLRQGSNLSLAAYDGLIESAVLPLRGRCLHIGNAFPLAEASSMLSRIQWPVKLNQ